MIPSCIYKRLHFSLLIPHPELCSISNPILWPPSLQVALVFPNNDPVAFMVAFYGCLLAEVVPVPIEVPLSRKVRYEMCFTPGFAAQQIKRSIAYL